MSESPLAALARRLGIAQSYCDVFGETHAASEETLLGLLDAFDLPPDPAEAERLMAAREGENPFGLPPVVVLGEGRREIWLKMPGGDLAWSCAFERGGVVCGALKALPVGEKAVLPLPAELPEGYHRLRLEAGRVRVELPLIVAPNSCHLPEGSRRRWGLLCQLYGVRSARNWGIGDFGDLAALARELGRNHAAVLGSNPLHALFPCEPQRKSPYAPSDRHWINPLYIDVTAVPGFTEDGAAQALCEGEPHRGRRREAQASEFVDYPLVAALKRPVLEALYRSFRARELGEAGTVRGPRGAAFRQFQRERGPALEDFAVFEALSEHFTRESGTFSWHLWPQPYQDPRSRAVRDFASAQRERVEYYEFLQWESERQLGLAASEGREAGLAIYRDLAVGSASDGAEVWAARDLFAARAAIGAPPDLLARNGQDWGLPPWNSLTLRQRGFAPFIALLRANMRHAGVLRIDHVMSLARLFWIPKGMPAKAGTYVSYPFAELLAILALESRRARCAVIGEDLGTVPEGLRQRLRGAGVLSFRVLAFEKDAEGGFLRPESYPALAAAAAETHDLATIKGFWLGRDIAWRRRLSLYPDEKSAHAEVAERSRDRRLLLEALAAQGLLPRERFAGFLSASGEPFYSQDLMDAILGFLARSPSRLLLVALEDLLGDEEQPNLPGTTEEHPNWRRRARLSLEELFAKGEFARVARLIAAARAATGGSAGESRERD
jgi:4-alpha-glucanotransferase